jgi:DNA-binding transcriptional LysR family regulator
MPYMARHTGVRVSVMTLSTDAIFSQLDNLELDVGITYIDTEPVQRFQTVPLYEEHYALLVAPGHPLAERTSMTWSEAGDIPLCLLTPDMQNRRIIDQHLLDAGSTAAPQFESNSMTMLHVHVRTGTWATIAAVGAGDRFEPPMQLRAIPLTQPAVTHLIGLVLVAREPHPPHVAAFLNAARKAVRPVEAVTV